MVQIKIKLQITIDGTRFTQIGTDYTDWTKFEEIIDTYTDLPKVYSDGKRSQNFINLDKDSTTVYADLKGCNGSFKD